MLLLLPLLINAGGILSGFVLVAAGYFAGKFLKVGFLYAITAIELTVLAYVWLTTQDEIAVLIPVVLSSFEIVFLSAMWLTYVALTKYGSFSLMYQNIGKNIFRQN